MIQHASPSLSELYELDETAWLETMAELIQLNRHHDLDYTHLQEYLEDMARRDRREVENRLAVLIAHVLKWAHQPGKRTGSWRSSIVEQRHQLARLLGRRVLHNHADAVLAQVYQEAIESAMAETGLPLGAFAGECPYTLEKLLSSEVLAE